MLPQRLRNLNNSSIFPGFALLFSCVLLVSACTTPAPRLTTMAAQDGLRAASSSFDEFYLAPNVDFSAYRNVLIEPLGVSYSSRRHHDNLQRGEEAFRFDEVELRQFRQTFADAFSKTCADTLDWQSTTTVAADTVILRAEVVDLYLYTSIKNDSIYPNRTVANETSEMVLLLTLIDGPSGKTLLRLADKRQTGLNNAGPEWMMPVSGPGYWHDAGLRFRQWAIELGAALR